MLNNKSSSVKLDLGPENEEEEEYEEESEEEEIPEIEGEGDDMDDPLNMDDDMIDMDMDMEMIDNKGIDKVTDLQKNQNNPKDPATIATGESNPLRKNETDKYYQNTKNPREIKLKPDQGEKTVFTRLSEELYKKFLSNKDSSYKKTSAYDYFINDKFLNRVVEKNDPTAAVKFGNFLNRNKEYVDRKVARLNERIQNITNEVNSNCTGIPNGKTFNKEELRDPNEFLKDQLKYYETIGQQIEGLRHDILSSTNSNIRNAPEISKKSKTLAEKKLNEENVVSIHDRLFKEKLNKEKKHIIKEKKDEKKKSKKEKIQEKKKKTIDEIKDLVEILHKDALERKMKKTQVLEDQSKLREFYNIYNSEDELSTFKSKVIILEKFVQSFERALHNMFNQRESIEINFEEYCKLMKTLGFTLCDHSDKNINEVVHYEDNQVFHNVTSNEEAKSMHSDSQLNEEIKRENDIAVQSSSPKNKENNDNSNQITSKLGKDKFSEKKELSLLKDSWKILSNGQEDNGKINSNQLLVFCASILGIYKGESDNYSESASKVKLPQSPVAEDNSNVELKDLASKSGTNFYKKNPKLNGTKQNNPGKKIKIPNRFSTHKELVEYNTVHGKSTGNKNKTAKSLNTSDKQTEKNPLKTVVPELDTSKHFYLNSTVKLIKELFVNMYLNRTEFVAKEKKRMKIVKKLEHENPSETLNSRSSDKLRRSAENFKRRVFEEYENSIRNQNNSQSPNQSLSNNTYSKKKKYKMEDIYKILKLKKENEIAKYKEEQKQLEIKECTFQPNKDAKKINTKEIEETIKNLYVDGVNKLRSKKTSETKEQEKLSADCTFRPLIHEINTRVFEVNPLLHDEKIKKEIEKLEKARIDKKLVEYKKQRGINVIKNFNSADLKNEELPKWRFEIEKKTLKDPIELAVHERGNSSGKNKTISRRDFDKTIKLNTNLRTIREPLFNVEVNIDDNYRTKKLEIYPDDDPAKLAESFRLSDEKREKLHLIINEKLHEHLI